MPRRFFTYQHMTPNPHKSKHKEKTSDLSRMIGALNASYLANISEDTALEPLGLGYENGNTDSATPIENSETKIQEDKEHNPNLTLTTSNGNARQTETEEHIASAKDNVTSDATPAPSHQNENISPDQILRVERLIDAIRRDGHQAANIDPLGLRPRRDKHLSPKSHGINDETLAQPAHWLAAAHDQAFPWLASTTIGKAIEQLKLHYCGNIGYEFGHIHNREERLWLQNQVENQSAMAFIADSQKRYLLELISRVEGLELFLHSAFPGKRWYGLDGLEALVALVDQIVLQSTFEIDQIVIGMSHRGRLNVLAHVLEQPYQRVITGFLEGRFAHLAELEASGWMTDVKYHLGSRTGRDVNQDGVTDILLRLLPNPSHLGMVVPTALGAVRSIQDRSKENDPHLAAMPLLIHGDGAFAGQGIISESLNLTNLKGYTVGGAIHVIANNQLSFTTEPTDSYSGEYASDVARGYEVPVVHVNAEDLEACVLVAKMAVAYRLKFRKEFVIDLVGYRRHGHNENDEPSFTQPEMYKKISTHPSLRQQWAQKLIDEEILTREDAQQMVTSTISTLHDVMRKIESSGEVKQQDAPADLGLTPESMSGVYYPATAVDEKQLRELSNRISSFPNGFTPHPTVARTIERRRVASEKDDANIDWAHAEALAFGSILQDGITIRLTGQDCERGTFSQRHAVMHDVNTGKRFSPLENFPQAPFHIYNSPLSELGPVGYEHGYSVLSEDTLVVWEAQFGDFANNAQSIIDEMVVSAFEKWGQRSDLVLLMPHGYEGQGPNHSHAYIERFLSLAANSNVRVTYPTSAAQYFHLLRTQAASLRDPDFTKPLVVMTPKSLLRHPLASSRFSDLAQGEFNPIRGFIFSNGPAEDVQRVVLCTGKVFVDMASHPDVKKAPGIGVIVIDELYPFPDESLANALDSFPQYDEVVWLQEEPINKGAWDFVREPISAIVEQEVKYIGRPRSASPASGSNWLHRLQQDMLIHTALNLKSNK